VENGLAAIPNILLQNSVALTAYAYTPNRTLTSQSWKVVVRQKPEDYVYTETEVRTWETIEAEAANAIAIAQGVRDDYDTLTEDIAVNITAAEDAKSALDNAITSASTSKTNLETAINNANDAKTNADTARTNLQNAIDDSTTKATVLQGVIDSAIAINNTLGTTNETASTTKSQLEQVIIDAGTIKSQLSQAITDATTINSTLNGTIQSGRDLKQDLDTSNEIASTAKTNLETAISNASTAKGQLEQVIADTNDAGVTQVQAVADEGVTQTQKIINEGASYQRQITDIKSYIGYIDDEIVGLQVDYQNKSFQRLGGAYGLSAGADFDKFEMFGGRKRCNVADDGTIVTYHGDEDYTEDGSIGQVMVYQPAFYYKVVPLVYDRNIQSGIGYHLRKANYYVSTRPKTGFRLHPAFYDKNGNPVSYILLSAYEGSMWDADAEIYVNDGIDTTTTWDLNADLICSIAGQKPISGLYKVLSKPNLETLAANRGDGWHGGLIKAESANQLLMMIEFGTMNTQTAIGQGITSITDNSLFNCSSLTGSTAALGNMTGQADETINEINGVETVYNTSGRVAVTYRGMENPWGNFWKHVDGVNIWGDGTMGGGQPYIADNFVFNESKRDDNYKPVGFTIANANGYISAMGYGGDKYDWLFMPSETVGNSSLPVGDYYYCTPNLNGYRIARLGGYWNLGGFAGGFFWTLDYSVGRDRNVGGRLVYIPTAA